MHTNHNTNTELHSWGHCMQISVTDRTNHISGDRVDKDNSSDVCYSLKNKPMSLSVSHVVSEDWQHALEQDKTPQKLLRCSSWIDCGNIVVQTYYNSHLSSLYLVRKFPKFEVSATSESHPALHTHAHTHWEQILGSWLSVILSLACVPAVSTNKEVRPLWVMLSGNRCDHSSLIVEHCDSIDKAERSYALFQ